MQEFAAIDSDFLSHLVDINDTGDAYDLIVRFFGELDFTVVMHPLVRKYEINPNKSTLEDKLFSEGVITVPELADIWSNKPGGKRFYEIMVKEMYTRFTGQQYPCTDVCSEWKKQDDLGEIHTAAMCVFMGYGYLLSDDKSVVKKLGGVISRVTQASVQILNRDLCCDILKSRGLMKSNERNRLCHKT